MGSFNNGGFSPSNTVVTDLEVDEGTISVDTSNNFVGIGTTTPRTDLTVEGTITVKERAAAKGDTAAYGQLWVKSDAPTSLYFTTDAGSDIQITSGTGLTGVSGTLSGLGGTDNVILRANGTGGETAQGSGISIDDSNNVSGMGTLGCGAITTTGVFDITDTTDSSDATGDTGALRTEGGASIAKKLYVGTDLDVDGTANLDNTDVDGTLAVDGTTISLDATTSLNIDNSNTSNGITIGTATSGVPISIGHTVSETTVNDNLSVTGDLAVDGTANLDNTDIDGTFTMDGTAFDVNSTTTCAIDNTNTSNGITINTATSGGPISIGHTTSETTVNDNLTVTGDLAINGASTTLTSSGASEPVLHITNTNAGATSGELRFNNDSASGADNDVMGLISFYGTDAAENAHERLAYVDAAVTDSAHGSEAASLRFYVAENDATLTQGLLIAGQADDDGEVDVTIAAGAASTTTITGTLTMGSTAALTNAGLVAVANQSNITGVGALASGTIAAGFGAIDNGTSGIRTNTFTAETSVLPDAVGGADLGSTSAEWGDIYMADGKAIKFGNDQEITLTHVQDTGLILASAAASTPVFEIKNENNGATAGVLKFNNTEAGTDGADDDDLGSIQFWGNDDGTPTAQQYANILAEIHDATSDEESGKLVIKVATHDGGLDSGLMLIGSDADGKVDVTLGNGSAQVTTVAGNLKVIGNVIQASDGGSTITMDASDNVTVAGKVTATGGVDSSTTVAVAHSTTAAGLTVTTNSVTTGAAVAITANGLTTGAGLNVASSSTDKTGTSVLAKFSSTGERGHASNPHIGVMIDFDSTAGTAAKAFYIDSEQTTGRVIDVDADAITTGVALEISTDARTTGTALNISDSATGDSAGSLVKIAQTGSRAGSAASIGLDIDFNTVANANARAFRIDSEQSTGVVAEINGDGVTTGTVLDISADGLTTGSALEIEDASANGGTRTVVEIEQEDGAAIAATALGVVSNGGITGISLDKNYEHTTAATVTGLSVDLDKTAATTSDNIITGINVDVDNTTATNGTNIMFGGRFTPTLTHAADAGVAIVTGMEIISTGATNGTATAIGISVIATGADTNNHIELLSGADVDDKCTIAVGSAGATTITTVDDGGAAADLLLALDGDFVVDAVGGANGISMNTAQITVPGPGANHANGSSSVNTARVNGEYVTIIQVDIHGNKSQNTVGDVIGEDGAGDAYLTKIETAKMGRIYKIEMICKELPTTGELNIDLIFDNAATELQFDAATTEAAATFASGASNTYKAIDAGGDWTIGLMKDSMSDAPGGIDLNNYFVYLANGDGTHGDTAGAAGTYGAGQFVIKLYGV